MFHRKQWRTKSAATDMLQSRYKCHCQEFGKQCLPLYAPVQDDRSTLHLSLRIEHGGLGVKRDALFKEL